MTDQNLHERERDVILALGFLGPSHLFALVDHLAPYRAALTPAHWRAVKYERAVRDTLQRLREKGVVEYCRTCTLGG